MYKIHDGVMSEEDVKNFNKKFELGDFVKGDSS